MEAMRWDSHPDLRRPALVCSFKGWNDAAESATTALSFVASRWDAQRIGSIDPEDFYDFQVTRPTVKLSEGVTRVIEWPELELSSARPDGSDRDVVFLTGSEPNLRWRTFSETVVAAAQELGCEMVVSLGALLADVPHTRPVQITGIAADAALAERPGFPETRYEGPPGSVAGGGCRRLRALVGRGGRAGARGADARRAPRAPDGRRRHLLPRPALGRLDRPRVRAVPEGAGGRKLAPSELPAFAAKRNPELIF